MNDMEWGGVRWSNWSGLTEVTRTMQVQRGLGASRVSAPSIGGSINIVTRSSEAEKGGAVSYTMGNDGYNRMSFNLSTGLNDNGWAMSILGSRTAGDGYIMGTEFESYGWFIFRVHRIDLFSGERLLKRTPGAMPRVSTTKKIREIKVNIEALVS